MVVVLPASICAMTPMLRTLASSMAVCVAATAGILVFLVSCRRFSFGRRLVLPGELAGCYQR